VRAALENAKRVVVLEKSLAVGIGGIVASDVRKALRGLPIDVYTVIAGLGGRAITRKSLHGLFEKMKTEQVESVTFLDLDWNVVNRQLEREKKTRRSGPAAESMLRDVGTVASKIA
jgi:pyruvate ferredoxin oxidoreductase alpha subunit